MRPQDDAAGSAETSARAPPGGPDPGTGRYVLALALLGLALAVIEFFLVLDPDTGVFGVVLVAAVVAAGLWGRGPGVLVCVGGILAVAALYQLPRARSLDAVFWARTAVRLGTGLLAVWVVASLRAARDRSERLRCELEIDKRLRATIMGVITHDLRSPLTAIRLHAQVARRTLAKGGDPARVPAALDAIVAATAQLDALVSDLGDMVRIEAGALRVRPRPLDPAALARQVVDVQRPVAEEKGVQLTLDAEPGVPSVCGDRLDRALTNLVGNALKFTPRGGSVTVTVTRSGAGVRLTVADTGTGIAPEHLPFVFDRGVRAPKEAGGGSGLGLYITRGIVAANGGWVTVASRPSEGSTFTITLPPCAAPSREAPRGPPGERPDETTPSPQA